MLQPQEIQSRIEHVGKKLLSQSKSSEHSARGTKKWLMGLLGTLADDDLLRVQLLRFIDVLPALKRDADLVEHMKAYFLDAGLLLPDSLKWEIKHADQWPAAHVVAPIVRESAEWIGHRFIAGHKSTEAERALKRLMKQGRKASLDILGEAVLSESEADAYQRQYLELIDSLAPNTKQLGPLHLSIKASSLYSQMKPWATKESTRVIKQRLRPILMRVRKCEGSITLDMEHYDTRHIILKVFREILMEREFKDWDGVGIALQTYLKDTEGDLTNLIQWAKDRGTAVWVRLVRGAYWDMETVVARREGWPLPVWEEKWQTDQNFERCLALLIKNNRQIHPAIATHNVRSLALAMVLIEDAAIPSDRYEFQMLYGMAEGLQAGLVEMEQPLRIYVPTGPIIPGMAYLVRRLLENSSNTSFLHQAMMPRADDAELLAEPLPTEVRNKEKKEEEKKKALLVEPVHRFVKTSERQHFSDAIEHVRGELGGFHPLMIGGRDLITEQRIQSFNPTRPSELVGEVSAATEKEADSAVAAASSALPAWRKCSASERAKLLRNAAGLLRNRRDQFSAWEVFEVGKTWREADADVAEAIDYMHYYADQAERLDAGHRFDVSGETNAYLYQPQGVAVILPPWNFPLAIAAGMLSAAIVCGNTAILKPSSQSPVIAALLVRLLHEAGLPEGVINYLPAEGRSVGEYLVRHPGVNLIAFTGSRRVGIRIQQLAANCMAEQGHIKHVIAEMGGKNAIIVDEDADLDDAIAGIVASAFGYAGQKCSACSRVIALDGIYDELLPRLVEAAESLPIGPPEDPSTFLGPVISASVKERIEQVISAGRKRGLLLHGREVPESDDGFFIGPAIFSAVPPDDPIAQEEIFGPVVAVMKAESFDHALEIANGTAYALTGGVYSRNPHHIDQAASSFNVGNLYLNRTITGAVVGRNPFGGFRMSGVGHKAGGPDYLLQFVQAKTVTENTLRRGFAPE